MITFSNNATHFMWVIAETVIKDGADSALALWRKGSTPQRACTDVCPYGMDNNAQACLHCLEGRLRTMNLYRQTPPSIECIFLHAADILKNGATTAEATSPAAA